MFGIALGIIGIASVITTAVSTKKGIDQTNELNDQQLILGEYESMHNAAKGFFIH